MHEDLNISYSEVSTYKITELATGIVHYRSTRRCPDYFGEVSINDSSIEEASGFVWDIDKIRKHLEALSFSNWENLCHTYKESIVLYFQADEYRTAPVVIPFIDLHNRFNKLGDMAEVINAIDKTSSVVINQMREDSVKLIA